MCRNQFCSPLASMQRECRNASQVSTAHGFIIGGAFPNHLIDIPDDPVEVKSILTSGNILKAEEIKACVVTFQDVPKGQCPFWAIAARPQTKNACFINPY